MPKNDRKFTKRQFGETFDEIKVSDPYKKTRRINEGIDHYDHYDQYDHNANDNHHKNNHISHRNQKTSHSRQSHEISGLSKLTDGGHYNSPDLDEFGNINGLIDYTHKNKHTDKKDTKNKKRKNTNRKNTKRQNKKGDNKKRQNKKEKNKKDKKDPQNNNVSDNLSDNVNVNVNLNDNVSDSLNDNVSDNLSDNVSDSLSDNVSDSISDNVSDSISDNVSTSSRNTEFDMDSTSILSNSTYDSDYTDNSEDIDVKKYLKTLDPIVRDELMYLETQLKNYCKTNIPDKIKILQLDAPFEIKAKVYIRYGHMKSGSNDSSDSTKVRKWLDFMLMLPWNRHSVIPISINDGYIKINHYLRSIQDHLDVTVYGQDPAKSAVLEMIAQWIINPSSKGLVLGFEGPPGTGKTSLMRHGVAYALNRPFVSIPLGGASGGSFLDGSNMVFEGSSAGKIVTSLIDCKCMDPVFYFDELDKISSSPHGVEVSNILVHLTDPSQNYDFHDKFLEVGLNVSRGVYIFSYNDPTLIDPILLDRIKRIRFDGFHTKDKISIAINHCLPKIYKEWGFKKDDIVFPPKIIEHIINKYTNREAGVRQMIHCMEMIVSKLNLCRISDPHYYTELSALPVTITPFMTEENKAIPHNGKIINNIQNIDTKIVHIGINSEILTTSSKARNKPLPTNFSNSSNASTNTILQNPSTIELVKETACNISDGLTNIFQPQIGLLCVRFPLVLNDRMVDSLLAFL